MRRYFQRLENCHYRLPYRWLSWLGINPTRHGFRGWLHTEKAIPMMSVDNRELFEVIAESAFVALEDIGREGGPGALAAGKPARSQRLAHGEGKFHRHCAIAADHAQSRAHWFARARAERSRRSIPSA